MAGIEASVEPLPVALRAQSPGRKSPNGMAAPMRASVKPVAAARANPWPMRLRWAMLIVLSFVAFESVLLAVVLKGHWLALIVPGIVCAIRAAEVWREISTAPPP